MRDPSSHYFGDTANLETDALSQHAIRGGSTVSRTERGYKVEPQISKPLSFLRPMTPYGDSYTPSYTRFLNAPGTSYVNPLFPLFNDRRSAQPKIRTSLRDAPPEEDD